MKAYIALIIGALSISTSAIFVKFTDAPSAVIAFYRLFFRSCFHDSVVYCKTYT